MSDTAPPLAAPALALWEFPSIADGVLAADAIAKSTPVQLLSGTTHPGKYVILAAGDTASVDVALGTVSDVGRPVSDVRFLPDIDPAVVHALGSAGTGPAAEAIGVVETDSVPSCVDAADAAVKAAAVDLTGLHLADDLGGKAYLVVEGSIGDVEAAVESAADRAGAQLVNRVVIPLLTDDLRDDLAASDRFLDRLSGVERGAS